MQNDNILENVLSCIEFSYMLSGTVLDRVSSINDLGVIMDEKMKFSEHIDPNNCIRSDASYYGSIVLIFDIDVMVGKAFSMLGFIRRLSFEFRDPYTLRFLHTSLVRPKLEYASCAWRPFCDVRVDKVERVQSRFIRYLIWV
jgi:hypothetical protein